MLNLNEESNSYVMDVVINILLMVDRIVEDRYSSTADKKAAMFPVSKMEGKSYYDQHMDATLEKVMNEKHAPMSKDKQT